MQGVEERTSMPNKPRLCTATPNMGQAGNTKKVDRQSALFADSNYGAAYIRYHSVDHFGWRRLDWMSLAALYSNRK